MLKEKHNKTKFRKQRWECKEEERENKAELSKRARQNRKCGKRQWKTFRD